MASVCGDGGGGRGLGGVEGREASDVAGAHVPSLGVKDTMDPSRQKNG